MYYFELFRCYDKKVILKEIKKVKQILETTNDINDTINFERYLFDLKVMYNHVLYLDQKEEFWNNKRKWLNGCSGYNRIEDYISSNIPQASMKQIKDSYYESLNN